MQVTVDIKIKGDPNDGTLITVHEERWIRPCPDAPKVAAELADFCDRVRDKAVAAVTA